MLGQDTEPDAFIEVLLLDRKQSRKKMIVLIGEWDMLHKAWVE